MNTAPEGATGGPEVSVLRLNHRPGRDARVTTHVALTARALGARGMFLTVEDAGVVDGVDDVASRFGGDFRVDVRADWRPLVRSWEGTKVHLTMYGERLDDALPRIPRNRPVLLVVGSAKVPRDVYDLADLNVSVGNQPHSEVAAVAIFMDRLAGGADLYRPFGDGVEIVPQARGKRMVDPHMTRFPPPEACRDILLRVGCDAHVVEHCGKVAELARDILEASRNREAVAEVDQALLVAGAWLHDMGRSVDHGTGHVVEGVRLGREMGIHPLLIRIIARHIGSGLTAGEAGGLGFPPDVYMPSSREEKLVSLADSLTEGSSRTTLAQQAGVLEARGLSEQAVRLRALYGEVEQTFDVELGALLPAGGDGGGEDG